MDADAIRERILELGRTELGLEGELPEGDLAEHLDSVQRLTLVVAIEDTFRICLEPDDEQGLATLDDVVALVARSVDGADGEGATAEGDG